MALVGLEDEAVFGADDDRRAGNVDPGRAGRVRRVDVVSRLELEARGTDWPAHRKAAVRQAVDSERRRLHVAHAHLEAALAAVAAIIRRDAGHGGDADREEGA